MPVCKVCYNRIAVGNNFGAESCSSCAAFFRRTVRLKLQYHCCKDRMSCNWISVHMLTAVHACKKCRYDRCLREGMNSKYVQNARPAQSREVRSKKELPSSSQQLPLLSSMTKLVKAAFQHAPIDPNLDSFVGTSESGKRFFSHTQYKLYLVFEYQKYRKMLDFMPVLCELETQVKDLIFRNSLGLYMAFLTAYHQFRHVSLGCNPKKLYIDSNSYLDLTPAPLMTFIRTIVSCKPLVGCDGHYELAKDYSKNLFKINDQLSGETAKSIDFSEFEISALLLLIVIHSNDFDKTNAEWQRPILRLKQVWTELDAHYRTTDRDPSSSGDLALFVANLQVAAQNFHELDSRTKLCFGPTVYDRIVHAELPQEALAEIFHEITESEAF